jgi:cell division protein FtsW (lipid II flippase)
MKPGAFKLRVSWIQLVQPHHAREEKLARTVAVVVAAVLLLLLVLVFVFVVQVVEAGAQGWLQGRARGARPNRRRRSHRR